MSGEKFKQIIDDLERIRHDLLTEATVNLHSWGRHQLTNAMDRLGDAQGHLKDAIACMDAATSEIKASLANLPVTAETPAASKVPEYRELTPNEITMAGDEYLDLDRGWRSVGDRWGATAGNVTKYRRKK